MDIIAEILETDKQAEDKIKNAEAERLKILENADSECEKIKKQCDENILKYKSSLHEKSQKTVNEKIKAAQSAADSEIARLDKLFEQNGEKWAEETAGSIISMK